MVAFYPSADREDILKGESNMIATLSRRSHHPFLVVIALTLCAGSLVAAAPAEKGANAKAMNAAKDATKALDEARIAIRRADIDMCAAVGAHDADRFKGFVSSDARFYSRSEVSLGPERVAASWAPFLDAEQNMQLLWAPDDVVVAASGDLGVSRGKYEFRAPDDAGEIKSSYGQYVTVWRRDPDGQWRVLMDIGTPAGSAALKEIGPGME
jgi:ketosteroid isomerase-like protein